MASMRESTIYSMFITTWEGYWNPQQQSLCLACSQKRLCLLHIFLLYFCSIVHISSSWFNSCFLCSVCLGFGSYVWGYTYIGKKNLFVNIGVCVLYNLKLNGRQMYNPCRSETRCSKLVCESICL